MVSPREHCLLSGQQNAKRSAAVHHCPRTSDAGKPPGGCGMALLPAPAGTLRPSRRRPGTRAQSLQQPSGVRKRHSRLSRRGRQRIGSVRRLRGVQGGLWSPGSSISRLRRPSCTGPMTSGVQPSAGDISSLPGCMPGLEHAIPPPAASCQHASCAPQQARQATRLQQRVRALMQTARVCLLTAAASTSDGQKSGLQMCLYGPAGHVHRIQMLAYTDERLGRQRGCWPAWALLYAPAL